MPSGNVDICRPDPPVDIAVGKCRPCARGAGESAYPIRGSACRGTPPSSGAPRRWRWRSHACSSPPHGGRETRGVSSVPPPPPTVMPGLVPGIHVLRHRGAGRARARRRRDVDARNKSGHDGEGTDRAVWQATERGAETSGAPTSRLWQIYPKTRPESSKKCSFGINPLVSHGFHEVFSSFRFGPRIRPMQRRDPQSPTVRNMVSNVSRVKVICLFQIIFGHFRFSVRPSLVMPGLV